MNKGTASMKRKKAAAKRAVSQGLSVLGCLLIWLIWAVPVGACLVFPWLRLYLSLVWLLIGYSSLSYVTALLLRPVFRRLEQPKDDPKKDGTDAS